MAAVAVVAVAVVVSVVAIVDCCCSCCHYHCCLFLDHPSIIQALFRTATATAFTATCAAKSRAFPGSCQQLTPQWSSRHSSYAPWQAKSPLQHTLPQKLQLSKLFHHKICLSARFHPSKFSRQALLCWKKKDVAGEKLLLLLLLLGSF